MKDYLDELDKEIDSLSNLQSKKNDIVNTHILLNEWLDGTVWDWQEVEKKTWNKSRKNLKNNSNNSNSHNQEEEIKGKFISKFPDTKFYLPTLREWYTRYIPIWWNNETGAKNMWMVQYGNDILLIDCWVQFADPDMLWVNYSIPDVSFLTKYKKI